MEENNVQTVREEAPALFPGGGLFFLLFAALFYWAGRGNWVYAFFLAFLPVGVLDGLCANKPAKSLGYAAALFAQFFWIPFHRVLTDRIVATFLAPAGGGTPLNKICSLFVVPGRMTLPGAVVFAAGFIVLSVLAVKLAGLLPEKMKMSVGLHKSVVFCVRFLLLLLWAAVCWFALRWLLTKLSFPAGLSALVWLLPFCFAYKTWKKSASDVDKVMANAADGIRGPGDPDSPKAPKAMEIPDVTLRDVAGMKEAKEQIMLRMIRPLRDKAEAARHGITPGGGMLLYGPPGTGKTFLARAVAGELKIPFFTLDAADVFSKYVGESEQNIRNIFAEIRKNKLAVLFIDELETLFHKRTDELHETTRKVISILLQELDGVRKHDDSHLLLIGATNVPHMIDEAFLRSGRFDVQIFVDLPDAEARLQILKANFRDVKYPIDSGLLERTAAVTEKFSGADLNGLTEKIRQRAFATGAKRYTFQLFNDCLLEVRPSANAGIMREIRAWEAGRRGL